MTFLQLVYNPKQLCSGLLLLAMRDLIRTQGSNHTAYGIARFGVYRGNNEHTAYGITETPSLFSQTLVPFFSTLPYGNHRINYYQERVPCIQYARILLRSFFPRPTKGGILHTPCCALFSWLKCQDSLEYFQHSLCHDSTEKNSVFHRDQP